MQPTTRQVRTPEVIAPGHGHHFHFLNHLATIKSRPGATGSMSVVEFTAPRGFGPPLHRHDAEDELFVLLEGELALHSGDTELIARAGDLAVLPRGVPHTFQVRSDEARFTCVTAARSGVPRFDQLIGALGEPTDHPVMPEPGYVDATYVADVCQQHGIEVVGPPPNPLP